MWDELSDELAFEEESEVKQRPREAFRRWARRAKKPTGRPYIRPRVPWLFRLPGAIPWPVSPIATEPSPPQSGLVDSRSDGGDRGGCCACPDHTSDHAAVGDSPEPAAADQPQDPPEGEHGDFGRLTEIAFR